MKRVLICTISSWFVCMPLFSMDGDATAGQSLSVATIGLALAASSVESERRTPPSPPSPRKRARSILKTADQSVLPVEEKRRRVTFVIGTKEQDGGVVCKEGTATFLPELEGSAEGASDEEEAVTCALEAEDEQRTEEAYRQKLDGLFEQACSKARQKKDVEPLNELIKQLEALGKLDKTDDGEKEMLLNCKTRILEKIPTYVFFVQSVKWQSPNFERYLQSIRTDEQKLQDWEAFLDQDSWQYKRVHWMLDKLLMNKST